MPGLHGVYRKSNDEIYTGVTSYLKLPDYFASVQGLAEVEFFHGLYDSDGNGIDAGVFYRNGNWRLFTYSTVGFVLNGATEGNDLELSYRNWHSNALATIWEAQPGDTIELSAYYSENSKALKVKARRINPATNKPELKTYQLMTKLDEKGINTFRKGAIINREMNIAGDQWDSRKAYFGNAIFSRGTLTTKDGRYVPFGSMNSHTRNKWVDHGHPIPSNVKIDIHSIDEEGFSRDTCSIDTR